MYQILADYEATGSWEHLYYQGDPDYVAYDIECTLQIGDSGSVRLSVPRSNPGYARIATRRTLIDFRCDGKSMGVFEVREVSRDIYGTAEVYAVGELAWLFDSVQPQAEYHDLTSRQFLSRLLSVHNGQCPEHAFQAGIVDVADSNDSLYRFTNREQTLDAIRDKLVDRLGGNLRVRHVGAVRYLDYVQDATYGTEAEQTIRFGENLLDYADNFDVSDICTEVVPLGSRLENSAGDNSTIGNLEKRTTIESVNGGSDHISSDRLVARFGHIRTTHTWDDVAVPSNLLAKARTWLTTEQYERMHVTVRAIDLSMTDAQFGALRMGDYAYVVCEPFDLKARFMIRKRTYNPDDPSKDAIELGDTTRAGYVASQTRASSAATRYAGESERTQAKWLTNAIENVTAMMTGARGGYKLTEYDDEGRWLADYIMDSMDRETARVVRKVTLDGTAYSTRGVDGPYETAIMANGMILGKYIVAHSVTAEQIAQSYTKQWEDADTETLNTARTEFKAGDERISARVTQVQEQANGLREELSAEISIRANQISQTVRIGSIGSAINQSAERITITANKFGWQSTYSSMTTTGVLTAQQAVLNSATVRGKVIAGVENSTRLVMSDAAIVGYNERNLETGKLMSNVRGYGFGVYSRDFTVVADNIWVAEIGDSIYATAKSQNVTIGNTTLHFLNGFFMGT